MLGARFGGDIDCTSATLSQPGGYALRLNRAIVDGAFFLRQGASVEGTLDLTATTIGAIDDEQASWPKTGDLLLNRCQYGAFIGGPVDAASRLDWLSRQTPERWSADFWPQPYEQLSTVLREMGHDEDARAVLITKERLQRRARRARARNPALRVALATTDGILAVTLRYGRQPLLALLWLILFWAIGIGVFAFAQKNGAIKPNSPVILRSLEWTMCGLQQTDSRYMPSSGQTFADAQRPEKTSFPASSTSRKQPATRSSTRSCIRWMSSCRCCRSARRNTGGRIPQKPNGQFTLKYYFFQSVVGWALSLLAVAGFSGLVKSK